MADPPSLDESALGRPRIYAQLLQQQRRALERLTELRDELAAPVTQTFLENLRSTAPDAIPEGVAQVLAKIEDTIRASEFCQTEIRRQLAGPRDGGEDGSSVDVVDELPPALERFLEERKGAPGFEYDLRRDAERGWIIRWKEQTHQGTVRAAGRFYERPYAWLRE